jgi:predicted metal-dependent HD superfamily phosphohydrolase
MKEDLLEIEAAVFDFYKHSKQVLYYHDFNHTLRVVNDCDKIATGEGISSEDTYDLKIAAYFHDVGYTFSMDDHEDKSVEICADFLNKTGFDKKRIKKISSLILATKLTVEPQNLLEQIIKDADSGHLILKDFLKYSDLLRREREICSNKAITEESWLNESLSYIGKHRYYTDFAKENWQILKERTIFKLYSEKDKFNKLSTSIEPPGRGIETAFRVTLRNHMKLSDIADAKANILLSVNAVIISIALSVLIPKLDNPSNSHLIVPTMILVGFSLISIIFAIFSTMPKVTQGTFTKEDKKKEKSTKLELEIYLDFSFFGKFIKTLITKNISKLWIENL